MVGIGEVIGIIVSSLITSIIGFFVLKLLNEYRTFLKVFIVVLISSVLVMFLPYLSTLGVPIPWYVNLIISIVISLAIYKFGLDLSWFHAIVLMILTPVIMFAISFVLTLVGLGVLLTYM